ncbi:oligosaccharide flippase family protein [Qingshengfaniella alkalisoli]|nr:oligosaccharide flippase family protein [Qingshengfaniella alkalisoli]
MRRAFVFANIEQYFVTLIGFINLFIVARLLSPEEIGIAAIGVSLATIALTVKEFVSSDFLIQRPSLSSADTATAFSMMAAVSLGISAFLLLIASWVETIYSQPGLAAFLRIMSIAAVFEAFFAPFQAMVRRDMAFSTLAWVSATGAAATGGVTIACALSDFGFMSIAYGHASGAFIKAICAISIRPGVIPRRPSFAQWRAVVSFGSSMGSISVLDRIYVSMPQLILGRTMPVSAVGYYNRASVLCAIPDRFMMSAVFSFAYPALAASIRAGGDACAAYLRAQSYISVVYCPALAMTALLADPIVTFALGPGWDTVIPLVRILSLASIFWFPIIVTQPMLFALGANRSAMIASFAGRGVGMVVLGGASFIGLMALAYGQFLAIPFYALVSLFVAHRHVRFSWAELAWVTSQSLVVLACTVLVPTLFLVLYGEGLSMGLIHAVICAALAASGWLFGIVVTRHPIRTELRILTSYARRSVLRNS